MIELLCKKTDIDKETMKLIPDYFTDKLKLQ